MVFQLPWFSGVTQALNLVFSPVAYLQEEQLHAQIAKVIENIRSNRDFLFSIDRTIVLQTVFMMLVTAVTCLKHEGFREEREWRVIYLPHMMPSTLIDSAIEAVGGIPQVIYKLPLDGNVSDAVSDLDLKRLFDRMIIGPSQFPWPMYAAFTEALRTAGVEQPENRVLVSGIPIRS